MNQPFLLAIGPNFQLTCGMLRAKISAGSLNSINASATRDLYEYTHGSELMR